MAEDRNQKVDSGKRRDAVNAVRLMCLDGQSAAAASKTFHLYPCDVVAARRLLQEWSHYSHDTPEHKRVDYLLTMGWRKRRRPTRP